MPQTFIELPNTGWEGLNDAYSRACGGDRMPPPVPAAQGYDSAYLLAALNQAKATDGRKIHDALENLQTKLEGVVTTYDHPYSAKDHEAITANIPVMGLVKGGRVVPAHPEDLAGDSAVRFKPKT